MPVCRSLGQSNLFHSKTSVIPTREVYSDCKIADVCIVCEAFLQSCLENLLCDECRKPAETCLEKESTIDEDVEDTPLQSSFVQQLQIMKFQNAKNRNSRVKRKLIF